MAFGDPAGIGPELIAKVLSDPQNTAKADIFILGDRTELQDAIKAAGNVHVPLTATAGPNGAQILDDGTASSNLDRHIEASKEGGERCLYQLRRGLELAKSGKIDAIVFAPLNKTSMKLAGMKEEDELRWFANQLQYRGTTSEINIAGDLWTARVTSHVGIEKVAAMVTKEATLKAIELLHQLRCVSLLLRGRRHCADSIAGGNRASSDRDWRYARSILTTASMVTLGDKRLMRSPPPLPPPEPRVSMSKDPSRATPYF